ncbi:Uncharacterised protein [Mycobacteroides abscessus subsp. abscessus]|nr:Uncharacterised protein [Mycobacteroides abscessus subsp. abscessus]
MHDGDIAALGQRMGTLGGMRAGCVVFDIYGRQIYPRLTPKQTRRQLQLVRTLQNHQVDRFLDTGAGWNLVRVRPRAPAAATTVGIARTVRRQQVTVRTRHKRVHPGPMHVPNEDATCLPCAVHGTRIPYR